MFSITGSCTCFSIKNRDPKYCQHTYAQELCLHTRKYERETKTRQRDSSYA